ncbi:MAG: hypothetical protein RBU21_02520, partial [FCB group bacterium]|nr:hypothetical protein [FCB group bacterium]
MASWRERQALRLVLDDPSNGARESRRGLSVPGRRSDESDSDDYGDRIGEYLSLHYKDAANRFPYEEVEAMLTEANPESLDTSHSDRLNDILAGWLQNGRDGIEATLSALFKAAAVAALARVVRSE